jgi:hypothetical protein
VAVSDSSIDQAVFVIQGYGRSGDGLLLRVDYLAAERLSGSVDASRDGH